MSARQLGLEAPPEDPSARANLTGGGQSSDTHIVVHSQTLEQQKGAEAAEMKPGAILIVDNRSKRSGHYPGSNASLAIAGSVPSNDNDVSMHRSTEPIVRHRSEDPVFIHKAGGDAARSSIRESEVATSQQHLMRTSNMRVKRSLPTLDDMIQGEDG